MASFRILLVFLLVVLSGCATTYSDESRVKEFIEEAADAASAQDYVIASRSIDFALERSTGPEQAREYFLKNPALIGHFAGYVEDEIKRTSGPSTAQQRRDAINRLRDYNVVPIAVVERLEKYFLASMVELNATGVLKATVVDPISTLPSLQDPASRLLIVERTINTIREAGPGINRPVNGLLSFYAGRATADEKKLIRDSVPTWNVRRSELDEFRKHFPDYALEREKVLTARAKLEMLNGDRLLKEDIAKAASSGGAVQWVSADTPASIVVTVEKLRHNESVEQNRTETITYATYQVDVLKAALLMPRNASYIYEVVSSGISIEYGYVVTATENGKPIHDEVIRGTVNSTGNRCLNARVQNVFGGVAPASFVANNDMQSRCGGQSVESIEALRSKVYDQVAASILKVPTLKAAANAQ
jgi:hypothetical protein